VALATRSRPRFLPLGIATMTNDATEPRSAELTGVLSDEQRARLLEIANECPVHRTRTSRIHVETRARLGVA
jgi:hypothetical protein